MARVIFRFAAVEHLNLDDGGDAADTDTVNLTNSATQLQALAAQIAELPVADTRLVSEVQVSLATGTFQVAPVKVANNMLTQEKEFAQLEAQDVEQADTGIEIRSINSQNTFYGKFELTSSSVTLIICGRQHYGIGAISE